MAPNDVLPQVEVVRLRVTDLNPITGAVLSGAGHIYTTDALIRVGWSPVYTDGTEIEQLNGQGVLCNQYRTKDSFKRVNLTVELCSPNPVLMAKLTGGVLRTDVSDASRPYGFGIPEIGQLPDVATSVEWWSIRNDDGVADAHFPYEWYVAPFTKNWRLGDRDHANAAHNVTLTGQGYQNGNWGDGPRNDWPFVSAAGMRAIEHGPSETGELPAVSAEATAALSS